MPDVIPIPPPDAVRPDTGELVPAPATERVAVSERFKGASLLVVTPEQGDILMTPCDPNELDVLPTGEVYLSQIGYRRRLLTAFRPGGWALVPLDKPAMIGATLIQPWALYIGGMFVSSAYGEAEYYKNNPRSTYATAAESLKSNALMRCCKDLGIASECWDRRFTDKFRAEYCTKTGKDWKRKDVAPKDEPVDAVKG